MVEIHKHTDWLNANKYTAEERERICRELLGEAQYWNIHLYIKHMHDSTKRPWVGLTDEEIKKIVGPWGDTPIKGYTRQLFDQIEAKLREKNQ